MIALIYSVLDVIIDIRLFLSSCNWSFVPYWSFLIQQTQLFQWIWSLCKLLKIWRNKGFTYIHLTKTQAKQVNIKVTKTVSTLWETFAQSASRVRVVYLWGGFAVFFLFFFILWPFLLANGVSCLIFGIHTLAKLLKTAPVLPQKIAFDKTQITKCLSSLSNLKDDCSCWGWLGMLMSLAELGPNSDFKWQ